MRTTLDFSDHLLKRAKFAAFKRGVTLRELVSNALKHELASSVQPAIKFRRVRFPIVASKSPGELHLTQTGMMALELEGESRRSGFSL